MSKSFHAWRFDETLLLYACAVGIYPSRRIARACAERAGFLTIVAPDGPDFRTVSEFRRRRPGALSGPFVRVLRPAGTAGPVKPGRAGRRSRYRLRKQAAA